MLLSLLFKWLRYLSLNVDITGKIACPQFTESNYSHLLEIVNRLMNTGLSLNHAEEISCLCGRYSHSPVYYNNPNQIIDSHISSNNIILRELQLSFVPHLSTASLIEQQNQIIFYPQNPAHGYPYILFPISAFGSVCLL